MWNRHLNRPDASERAAKDGSETLDMYCLDRANSESKNEALKDLLWSLYSKLEAVLRGFRFTETCARRIKKVGGGTVILSYDWHLTHWNSVLLLHASWMVSTFMWILNELLY